MHSTRTLIRLAVRLDRTWSQYQRHLPDADEPSVPAVARAWDELQVLRRRLALARTHGLVHSRARLRESVRRAAAELARAATPIPRPRSAADTTPTLRDWVHEARALGAEFGEVEIDVRGATLGVTTDEVTLEGVELGPFAVDFVWSRLGTHAGPACFDVTALEPHPAADRDDVPHPHVRGDRVCAGEAAAAIDRAVRAGRIGDAFLLVRGVLTTYNPGSAYVELATWGGSPCGDCGGRMNRDESSHCPGCRTDLCDECSSSCQSCEATNCRSCLPACEHCGDSCCSDCLEPTAAGGPACPSCRRTCDGCGAVGLGTNLDEDGLCGPCAEAVGPETSPAPTLEERDVT